MRIANLTNDKGRAWANQIVIDAEFEMGGSVMILQSYDSKVAMIDYEEQRIDLSDDWDYSATTRRAVYKFLSDNVGFDFKLDKATITSALKLGVISDMYGKVWKVSPASHDFFEIFGALKS